MGKIDACLPEERLWQTIASLAVQGPGGWGSYEACKRLWVDAHPTPSPDEYDAAMARIARVVGV